MRKGWKSMEHCPLISSQALSFQTALTLSLIHISLLPEGSRLPDLCILKQTALLSSASASGWPHKSSGKNTGAAQRSENPAGPSGSFFHPPLYKGCGSADTSPSEPSSPLKAPLRPHTPSHIPSWPPLPLRKALWPVTVLPKALQLSLIHI